MRLTSEQEDLRSAVRGLLDWHAAAATADPAAAAPGTADPAAADIRLWQRLCREIGVAGLAIPERFGGSGAGPIEVHVVMEELGRSLTTSPMLGSAVLSTQVLLGSGDEAACARLLPGLADGAGVAALAWTTAAGHWNPAEVACRAQPTAGNAAAGDWEISGEAHYVLDGGQASAHLVPARMPDGGIGLFEVAPGQPSATCIPSTTMDDTRRLAVIRLTGALGRRIGDRAALARVRDAGCIALSAEQAGAAARALELTVAYTKDRVQFGRPIAAFQALQHRMADLYVRVQSARTVSYAAAAAAEQGAPDVAVRAATAKAYCSEVLLQVSAEMIQLHGAIGMTWDHPAHRYFKRGHSAAMLLGSPAEHVARVAAAVVGS